MPRDLISEIVRRITDLERLSRAVVGKAPLFDIANENTPAQLTGDQNNYDPGDYDVLRISSTLGITFTGFSGGLKGRFLELVNVGSFSISLSRENASSDPANRIQASTATVVIAAQSHRRIYYDSTQQRWIA